MIKNITNLGDTALYCDFGDEVNSEINSNVISVFNTLKEERIKGIVNLAPSYNKLIVSFDLDVINYQKVRDLIKNLEIKKKIEIENKTIEIPICLDNEFQLDLKRLEEITKMSTSEIYKIFFSKQYFCYMTGFIAGMPFMGDVDKRLQSKRLETPRIKVPKGSIGITEKFCNIYTFESPGGWNIIGNTPIEIFNKNKQDQPILINPGNKVQFYEISKTEYDKY